MILFGILMLIFAVFGYAVCVVAGREDDIEEERWLRNHGHFYEREEDK